MPYREKNEEKMQITRGPEPFTIDISDGFIVQRRSDINGIPIEALVQFEQIRVSGVTNMFYGWAVIQEARRRRFKALRLYLETNPRFYAESISRAYASPEWRVYQEVK